MLQKKVYTLPGFLGSSIDWELVFGNRTKDYALYHNNIHEFAAPHEGFWHWGKSFNSAIQRDTNQKNIIMGYSLGGRLAMHALLDNPPLWDGAILISCNPGCKTVNERESVKAKDNYWSNRFENDLWKNILSDWNAQPVLNRSAFNFERLECDYSRVMLCQILEHWSLSKQEDLENRLSELTIPILWIAGNKDQKYAEISEKIVLRNKNSTKWIVSNAGHRAPWEQTEEFNIKIDEFIDQI